MKWKLIGITYFGLMNISGVNLELLFAIALTFVIFLFFFDMAMQSEGYTSERIDLDKLDKFNNHHKIY